jgi:hypothetical protein
VTTALTDPQSIHNPSTGGTATAAWGDNVRDNIVTLSNMPGCIVARTSAQTITTATDTAIQFNASDQRDTDAYHDTVTNNTRMTVPSTLGGWYWAGGAAVFSANSTGNRGIGIKLNGATVKAYQLWPTASGGPDTWMQIAIPIQLVATDYVEVIVYQSSGGNLNTTASASTPTLGWLQMFAL